MTKQHLLALLVIALGIWANLEFQDAIAVAQGHDMSWEMKQLHEPPPFLLAREERGQVTIFDGLPSTEVDRALDGQFDRIGRMMFVRTRHVSDDGDVTVDDDCD
ncbi:MAG: hypothetical protein KDI88_04545 [Gammaproteobacteria bacterium]|nr:hypothetical protein [Gammaproteobacteria bacterium]